MADVLQLKISHSFRGFIWNMLADETTRCLFVEVRDVREKKVSFSALNLQNNTWLWKDMVLEEPWWVTMASVAGDKLLFTIYTDTNNPDKKSLVAYDIATQQMAWWYNGFALSSANREYVRGLDTRFPGDEIVLDAVTGRKLQHVDFDLVVSQNFSLIRPFQYEEGSGHFNTVKDFLQRRCGIEAVNTIEYLETDACMIMSVFVRQGDLANFLYVFDTGGSLLLTEKLGENLKGVGFDTFFIFSGHLIFVKDKHELTVYKIV